MATSRRVGSKLAQLWQLPLLLLSLGLFGFAAYLFIDPKPGLTIDQKIEFARTYLNQHRPEASIEHLNKLLATEKMDNEHQGQVHMMLAESLEDAQKEKRISVPANYQRIIEQTRLAFANGIKPDSEIYRRLGESFEALGRPSDALDNFRQSAALDPAKALSLQRKIIDLQLESEDPISADLSLESYARLNTITDAERAWALCQRAQLLIDQSKFADGRILLDQALKLSVDPVAQGEVNYYLGYAAWKMGDTEEAERYLRVAKDQLRGTHPLDADASYALGRIYQEKSDPGQANSFYEVVLINHPDAKVAPLSRLGRGVCRIMLNADDAGLTDLHDLTDQVMSKASRERFREPVLAGLRQAALLLEAKANYQGALELLAYEQTLNPEPAATFYGRLAQVYSKRADQIEKTIPDADEAGRIRRTQQVREFRSKAGDGYIAYSRALTLSDDKGYGDALWKGIDLYDRSGDIQSVISALELFVAERPDDALAPDAMLRLGHSYQAAGMFDKAISAYQRNQFRYEKSLAASKSAVPLAQAYIAKGPDAYSKAETVLLSVVENNPLINPQAEDFRQALFELAQLYYRTGRFEESVSRLEELTERYPKEQRMGQLLFLMGDSYRKSAGLLDVKIASTDASPIVETSTGGAASSAIDIVEAQNARKDRLNKARLLYERVIEIYRSMPPTEDVEKLYLKLSHFYRADCLYDLGKYEEAIRLYDAAAFRYQDDPSALSAYVQIVNAYCALGKIDEAKTANERAKWLLRRMPPEAFVDGTFSMPKAYWEQWLKWTSDAGMW